MKWLVAVMMFLLPMVAMGQTGPGGKDFPLTIHVLSSVIEPVSDSTSDSVKGVDMLDLLRVTVDGKKYVLAEPVHGGFFSGTHPVLLEPGAYPARLKLNKQPNPGELRQTYLLQLKNGKTVLAFLWGIGF
jgi:hypothetical protein